MENEEFYTILTNVGKAQIANAIALNTPIDIVKFHVGDGGGEYYNPTEEQTELKNKVWECSVNSVRVDENNPNWIVLEVVIPGTVGGFTIREVGAFDSEDNLIAIGKFPQTYKPHPTDGSLKELILKMVLEVSNTSCVVLKVDPTVILATKKDIEELSNKIDDLEDRLNNLKLVDTKVEFTDPEDKFGFGKKTNINKAIMKLADEIKKVLQFGVNIKNNVISAINSKLSVGDLPFSATWQEIIQAILDIKEGRGNAKPEHVLNPYKFTNNSGQELTGTMPDRGNGGTYRVKTTRQTLPAGYYRTDIVIQEEPMLRPENIKAGVSIGGVLGTYTGTYIPPQPPVDTSTVITMRGGDEKRLSVDNDVSMVTITSEDGFGSATYSLGFSGQTNIIGLMIDKFTLFDGLVLRHMGVALGDTRTYRIIFKKI